MFKKNERNRSPSAGSHPKWIPLGNLGNEARPKVSLELELVLEDVDTVTETPSLALSPTALIADSGDAEVDAEVDFVLVWHVERFTW